MTSNAPMTEIAWFNGMDVIVVPDDDPRMLDIDEFSLGTYEGKIYVRKTLWAYIMEHMEPLQPIH